ncbi:putative AMP-dependent synthetase/ligase, AMP-binding enzyme domain, ANL domain-containing protein [Helianthus debilis subsp. tardiflorus]
MFHCNGWTFPWGVAARGGTNVCIRNTTANEMYTSISKHNVTHMCCALVVFNILLEAKQHEHCEITSKVNVLTGGAPPPAPLLEKMEDMGFNITHAYGLTEATGPALVCEWQSKWNSLARDHQSRLKAWQGVSILTLADVDVKNKKTMTGVPHDGYLKDDKETANAFQNGWFFTGDVGVIHLDGYIEIKDQSPRHTRSCRGRHASSTVGREPACAFLVLRETSDATEAEILEYCQKNIPKFMVPKKVVFVNELPKTGTGKIQKQVLRKLAKSLKLMHKR